eukprot:m.25575 g.25575  ORF g.25575 m.25575 type:complete len:328 (-) comp11611_c0_seq1:99-1082(-)
MADEAASSFGMLPLIILVVIGLIVQGVHRMMHHASLDSNSTKSVAKQAKPTRSRRKSKSKPAQRSKSHSPRRPTANKIENEEDDEPEAETAVITNESESSEPTSILKRQRPRSISYAAKPSPTNRLTSKDSSPTFAAHRRESIMTPPSSSPSASPRTPRQHRDTVSQPATKKLDLVKGTMPELAVGQNPDEIDEEARKAAQDQAMAMLAAMGGGSRGGARGAFASKSALAPPMASSRSGTKLDQAASRRLVQAAKSIRLELSNTEVVVGQTTTVVSRMASSKMAEQLESALREAEMAAMYGGAGSSFSWRVESGLGQFEVTVKKSVM